MAQTHQVLHGQAFLLQIEQKRATVPVPLWKITSKLKANHQQV